MLIYGYNKKSLVFYIKLKYINRKIRIYNNILKDTSAIKNSNSLKIIKQMS